MAARREKVAAERAHLVPVDEGGLPLNPPVRRSWAPGGKTPVLPSDGGGRRKASVTGAVRASPAARRLGLDFATRPGGDFGGEAAAGFPRDLLGHLRGNVVVAWDGGPSHKGPAVREFLTRDPRLRLERPPAYCPGPNPVGSVWSWLEYGQPANYVPAGVGEPDDEVVERLIDLKFDPGLLKLPWGRSGLPLPHKPDE